MFGSNYQFLNRKISTLSGIQWFTNEPDYRCSVEDCGYITTTDGLLRDGNCHWLSCDVGFVCKKPKCIKEISAEIKNISVQECKCQNKSNAILPIVAKNVKWQFSCQAACNYACSEQEL